MISLTGFLSQKSRKLFFFFYANVLHQDIKTELRERYIFEYSLPSAEICTSDTRRTVLAF